MPTAARKKTKRPARASAPAARARPKAKLKPKAPERPAPKPARPAPPKPVPAPSAKGAPKTAPLAGAAPAAPARPGSGAAGAAVKTGSSESAQKTGVADLEAKLGRKLAIDHYYRPWTTPFPTTREQWDFANGRIPLWQRRGPNGELFQPGDLLLPGGPQGPDEIQYLLRGSVAAEHPAPEAGVSEIVVKKGPEAEGDRGELSRFAQGLGERFDSGTIEPLLPTRPVSRRNFAGVVERAKHRRREIGAFMRGLDLGRTESSHMDSHGEASLQGLMEWAARLENLAEADEPDNADYAQFHRGMDQLENTTEALIVDVELTLRRLRDRVKA